MNTHAHETPCQGAIRLAEWLVQHERSAAWLGRQVGVSPATGPAWVTGRQRPASIETMKEIERVTGGYVRATDWARS